MRRRLIILLCIILILLAGCEKEASVKVEVPKKDVTEEIVKEQQPDETEPIETTEDEEPEGDESEDEELEEEEPEKTPADKKKKEDSKKDKVKTEKQEDEEEPAKETNKNGQEESSKKEDNKKTNSKKKGKSYSPEKVVSLATQKVKAGGKTLLTENLDQLLEEGSITKEEYEEYYPYDGAGYYSVYVETDLRTAQTTSGKRLQSVDAIAEHIADMLLLESGQYFLIEYAGVYTLNGTKFYEFRCYRA